MSVQQLKSGVSDAKNGYGPWYVDRKSVVAFRTHKKTGGIEILLCSRDTITVVDCPENWEFLLDRK